MILLKSELLLAKMQSANCGMVSAKIVLVQLIMEVMQDGGKQSFRVPAKRI